MEIATYRLVLTGLGNVGRSFLAILRSQESLLRERYGVAFSVVGAADSGGAAVDPAGLDSALILEAKRAGRSVASLASAGRTGVSAVEMVRAIDADVLIESTPTNLQHGQPGLEIVRTALARGMHAVLASKGPLVLAYAELASMSDLAGGAETGRPGDRETRRLGDKETGRPGDTETRRHGDRETGSEAALGSRVSALPCLRFSACVGGALPTINLGRRDLAGARIARVEGVLNGTTQIILRMMESGGSYADALAEAQRRGLAETDPTLDVEGWDAANKLVILSNAVLGRPTVLADVAVEGITRLTAEQLHAATARGERIVLLCLAERADADYRLSVRPTALPLDHPLARMSGDEMGVVYYTDIAGRASATSAERGPEPTAAAMLRDLLGIVRPGV